MVFKTYEFCRKYSVIFASVKNVDTRGRQWSNFELSQPRLTNNSHNQLNKTNWYILCSLPISSVTFIYFFT